MADVWGEVVIRMRPSEPTINLGILVPTALSRLCKTVLIIVTKSWLLFYMMNISEDITSEDCEKIKEKLRCRLRSISTHNSMSKKVYNKANKLLGELDQFFQSKRVKVKNLMRNVIDNIANDEASIEKNTSSEDNNNINQKHNVNDNHWSNERANLILT
ncbi:hypothetical protein RhiirA5_422715 [Rhizophagus irregularis]|nr:hypothetical protein RhiirA5_422715 [Rhizophagus irregularis]